MDNWILKGAGTLVNEPRQESNIAPDEVKVKVTYFMPSYYDSLLFSGEIPAHYPVTIGRFAVGIVTEAGAECYGLEKNMRVLLHPTRPCGKCTNCKTGNEGECTSVAIAGRDFDGFLRDFVVCKYSHISPLPDSVSDMETLYSEAVAIGESVYSKLDLPMGSRVAVVGCNFAGNVFAQVLQYHKLIPIVIDNNPLAISRAKKCGIYYSFMVDDDLDDNINEATSGRLCDAAIYTTCSQLDPSLTLRMPANGKRVALAGFANVNFNIPARELMEKDITLFSVMHGYGYTDTAINLLVQDAVKIDIFEKETLTECNPVETYKALSAPNAEKRNKITVLKMII